MLLDSKGVFALLKRAGLPVSYKLYKSGVRLPYLVFAEDTPTVVGADDCSYFEFKNYRVELYSKDRDYSLEKRVQDIFTGNDIFFSKSEDIRLDEEDVTLINYYI